MSEEQIGIIVIIDDFVILGPRNEGLPPYILNLDKFFTSSKSRYTHVLDYLRKSKFADYISNIKSKLHVTFKRTPIKTNFNRKTIYLVVFNGVMPYTESGMDENKLAEIITTAISDKDGGAMSIARIDSDEINNDSVEAALLKTVVHDSQAFYTNNDNLSEHKDFFYPNRHGTCEEFKELDNYHRDRWLSKHMDLRGRTGPPDKNGKQDIKEDAQQHRKKRSSKGNGGGRSKVAPL